MSQETGQKILSERRSALWRALLYIQNNLDQEISLEEAAALAGYSPYHFHRLFKQFTGENFKSYLRRLRLENSAFLLKARHIPITDLAFDSGFYTHESFTRAFKKVFGTAPSTYRNREERKFKGEHLSKIEKIYFEGRDCVFTRYQGPYRESTTPEENNSLWHRLFENLPELPGKVYDYQLLGISHDDPTITADNKIRYDVCLALPDGVKTGAPTLSLHSGTCIKAEHRGTFAELTDSYLYLLYEWCELSGEKVKASAAPFEEFHVAPAGNTRVIEKISIYIPVENSFDLHS